MVVRLALFGGGGGGEVGRETPWREEGQGGGGREGEGVRLGVGRWDTKGWAKE